MSHKPEFRGDLIDSLVNLVSGKPLPAPPAFKHGTFARYYIELPSLADQIRLEEMLRTAGFRFTTSVVMSEKQR